MGKAFRIFLLFSACACVSLFAGCQTVNRTNGTDATLLSYQRQIAILEGRLQSFESGIGDIVEEFGELTERSSNIVGGIDEVITLFDEYQRRVNELILLYRALTEKGEDEVDSGLDTGDSVWSDDFSEDRGVCVIRQGD